MKHFLFIAILFAAICISCDDDTGSLGASIADYEDNAEYSWDEFDVTSRTVRGYNIHASTLYSYIGQIYDPETETTLTANFMTQLVPRNDTVVFSKESNMDDKISVSGTTGHCEYADSCYLLLSISSFSGDSLALINLTLNELEKPYEEGVNDTIGYDPTEDATIYDPSDPNRYKSKVSFTAHNLYLDIEDGTSSNSIFFPMNGEFKRTVTDKNNNVINMTFNNYGSYLMYMYYNHPTYFNSPILFSNYVCPGFYLINASGQGVMCKISATALEFVYRLKGSTKSRLGWLAGTKEVIQQSTIKESVSGSVNEFISKCNDDTKSDYSYVASPLGVYTELEFNVDGIMDKHEQDSLSTVRVFIPRENTTSTKGYVQDPPSTLLMIRNAKKESFFTNKEIVDDRTTFLASYSSTVNGYTFENISPLITLVYAEREKYMKANPNISYEEYDALFPEWNKVLLMPVETTYDSSSNLLTISHSMLLQGAKLKRMRETDTESPIQSTVIYSRFKDKD